MKLFLLAVLVGSGLLSGCVLERGPAPPARLASATPIPTFTPTPRLVNNPVQTPAPETRLSQSKAEFAVWNRISECANDVARSTQIGIEVVFSSSFDRDQLVWTIQASSGALDLDFGLWEVIDESGSVMPSDDVASTIASEEFVCGQPRALLADGLTPPVFSTPTPVPTPAPTATPAPPPTATPVPASTPTPTIIPTATPFLMVSTDAQAALRVWLAVRDCFSPLPSADSFTAYQDRPDRWLVEGKERIDETVSDDRQTRLQERTVYYGLWIVDSKSGDITAYDELANQVRHGLQCFKRP